MNHDDVIRLARQVADPDTTDPLCGGDQRDLITLNLDEMVRFAALVAAHEREMCAKLVEEMVKHDDGLDDFANSVRKGGRRLCSDGRPKWLKISMEVAAERKACADLCDAHGDDYLGDLIRERGKA
jgi:hypothetical protein